MDAAVLHAAASPPLDHEMSVTAPERLVDAAEFHRLLVSHRRMIRVDRREDRLKGLQDVETGEVFLIDEQRLLGLRR